MLRVNNNIPCSSMSECVWHSGDTWAVSAGAPHLPSGPQRAHWDGRLLLGDHSKQFSCISASPLGTFLICAALQLHTGRVGHRRGTACRNHSYRWGQGRGGRRSRRQPRQRGRRRGTSECPSTAGALQVRKQLLAASVRRFSNLLWQTVAGKISHCTPLFLPFSKGICEALSFWSDTSGSDQLTRLRLWSVTRFNYWATDLNWLPRTVWNKSHTNTQLVVCAP